MIKHCTAILLLVLLGVSPSLYAQQAPGWLEQVAAQKRQQPEAMLALLQQHQHELPQLSRPQQAQWYYLQAVLFDALGRHQQQQQAAEQGLALVAADNDIIKVKLLYELGFAREMQTDYPGALQHYLDGMTLATALENEKYILLGQINHAAILSIQNNDQQALALLKDTYQRAQQLNDNEVLAEVTAELGLLYSALGYDEEAIELLNSALQQYQRLDWPKNQITVLYNLARTYSYLQRYELSLQTYNQMLQKSQQLQDNVNLYHAYLGLAIASINADRGEAALSYIDKAEQYLPLLQSSAHLATHYYEKALILKKLDQVSPAIQQVLLAEQSLNKDGLREDVASRLAIWHLKAQLLAAQGEYQKAYHQLYDFVADYQDMRNKENELAFEQIRAAFEHERQQQQTLLLEQDNELKALRLQQAERGSQLQLVWLTIFAGSTLVLLILLLWQLARRKTKHMAPGADKPGQTG
ncbi:tetratricopeptide repeat protein [Rheinheimera pleomorphica]|uniref:tetratricopeptide repeat protein n=1 Tax=Rheinheimera pleomorphica TaxID=2703963 RepID=UPI001F51104D|nr:tetratricopeptide repeat protein [Rheinheimera pleomorphica]